MPRQLRSPFCSTAWVKSCRKHQHRRPVRITHNLGNGIDASLGCADQGVHFNVLVSSFKAVRSKVRLHASGCTQEVSNVNMYILTHALRQLTPTCLFSVNLMVLLAWDHKQQCLNKS